MQASTQKLRYLYRTSAQKKKQGYAVSQQSGDPTESNTCQTANKNDHTAAMLVVGFHFSPSGRRNENLSTT